jgi:hypothetical protein
MPTIQKSGENNDKKNTVPSLYDYLTRKSSVRDTTNNDKNTYYCKGGRDGYK